MQNYLCHQNAAKVALKSQGHDRFLPGSSCGSIFLLVRNSSFISSLLTHKASHLNLRGNRSCQTFQETLPPPFQEQLFNRFLAKAIDQWGFVLRQHSCFKKKKKNEASPSGYLKCKYTQSGFNYL